jgi:hypothetical protein
MIVHLHMMLLSYSVLKSTKGLATTSIKSSEEQEHSVVLDEALKELEDYEDLFQRTSNTKEYIVVDDDNSDSYDEEEKPYKASPLGSQRVVLQTYTSVDCEESYLVLNDLRPTHVVLYDADTSFIRSLELYVVVVLVVVVVQRKMIPFECTSCYLNQVPRRRII